MASPLTPRLAPPVAAPPLLAPPSARSLRARAVHRLQVGLLGLGAMLLLVGLANIIMDRARRAEVTSSRPDMATASNAAVAPAGDPLADIGMVPAADPSAPAANAPSR